MKMTSASANKLLRQLNDEYAFLRRQDSEKNTYSEIDGIEPIIPEYDLEAHTREIAIVAGKIAHLKHAINVFNTTAVLPEHGITIDEALVRMAFLTKEKERLDSMRVNQPKRLITGYSARKNQVEYECTNYNPSEAGRLYAKTAEDLRKLQLELDMVNSTVTFDFEE